MGEKVKRNLADWIQLLENIWDHFQVHGDIPGNVDENFINEGVEHSHKLTEAQKKKYDQIVELTKPRSGITVITRKKNNDGHFR